MSQVFCDKYMLFEVTLDFISSQKGIMDQDKKINSNFN